MVETNLTKANCGLTNHIPPCMEMRFGLASLGLPKPFAATALCSILRKLAIGAGNHQFSVNAQRSRAFPRKLLGLAPYPFALKCSGLQQA